MARKQKPNDITVSLYQEMSIAIDPDQVGWTDTPHEAANEIEKRVVVINGSQPVADCQVIVEDLVYQFRDEWIDPANGFEKIALRWVDEMDDHPGKIEIPANGSAKLAIARLYRYPNPYFGIAYYDNKYGKTHHFLGAYRLRLKLEAKNTSGNTGQTISTAIYDVNLNYLSALELEIGEIVRL